jgi:hypothetical protein
MEGLTKGNLTKSEEFQFVSEPHPKSYRPFSKDSGIKSIFIKTQKIINNSNVAKNITNFNKFNIFVNHKSLDTQINKVISDKKTNYRKTSDNFKKQEQSANILKRIKISSLRQYVQGQVPKNKFAKKLTNVSSTLHMKSTSISNI